MEGGSEGGRKEGRKETLTGTEKGTRGELFEKMKLIKHLIHLSILRNDFHF